MPMSIMVLLPSITIAPSDPCPSLSCVMRVGFPAYLTFCLTSRALDSGCRPFSFPPSTSTPPYQHPIIIIITRRSRHSPSDVSLLRPPPCPSGITILISRRLGRQQQRDTLHTPSSPPGPPIGPRRWTSSVRFPSHPHPPRDLRTLPEPPAHSYTTAAPADLGHSQASSFFPVFSVHSLAFHTQSSPDCRAPLQS